jgi:hypothetical protein
MKYRVLEQKGYYYPQYKGWFFWHHYYTRGEPMMGCDSFVMDRDVIAYTTLEEAYFYLKTEEFKLEIVINESKITIHPYPPTT